MSVCRGKQAFVCAEVPGNNSSPPTPPPPCSQVFNVALKTHPQNSYATPAELAMQGAPASREQPCSRAELCARMASISADRPAPVVHMQRGIELNAPCTPHFVRMCVVLKHNAELVWIRLPLRATGSSAILQALATVQYCRGRAPVPADDEAWQEQLEEMKALGQHRQWVLEAPTGSLSGEDDSNTVGDIGVQDMSVVHLSRAAPRPAARGKAPHRRNVTICEGTAPLPPPSEATGDVEVESVEPPCDTPAGAFTLPTAEYLQWLCSAKPKVADKALAALCGFTLVFPGQGAVTWLAPLDVRGLSLARVELWGGQLTLPRQLQAHAQQLVLWDCWPEPWLDPAYPLLDVEGYHEGLEADSVECRTAAVACRSGGGSAWARHEELLRRCAPCATQVMLQGLPLCPGLPPTSAWQEQTAPPLARSALRDALPEEEQGEAAGYTEKLRRMASGKGMRHVSYDLHSGEWTLHVPAVAGGAAAEPPSRDP